MSKVKKAACPTCDGERNCRIHGSIRKLWDETDRDGYSLMDGGVTHSLLECKGCETVFYETISWHSEDMDQWYDSYTGEERGAPALTTSVYPRPDSKTAPVWLNSFVAIDLQMHRILEQTYTALDSESLILATIGVRTALDRATDRLGIDPALTFKEKLDQLQFDQLIGGTERELLSVVIDAGNAAAHQGWAPDARQVRLLISAFEVFLQRAFIVGKDALSVKAKIPAKPKRRPANKQASAPPTPKALPAPSSKPAAKKPRPKKSTD